jgi:hypothetical protein
LFLFSQQQVKKGTKSQRTATANSKKGLRATPQAFNLTYLPYFLYLWHCPLIGHLQQLLPQEDLPAFLSLTRERIINATTINRTSTTKAVPIFS